MRGLVLEGGGMRGIFTAGVLDAFLDLGIEFDQCVAISAGALNGISYLSKQRERNLRVMRNYQSDPNYISIKNWLFKGSIFNMEFLLETIPEKLDPVDEEAFKKNPCKLYAGIFDIESGELLFPEIKDTKADKLYLQAAASLPLLSKVVHINGHKYLDGGIWDSFGLDFALQNGCDKVVVINTRDKEYQREKEKTLPLMKMVYRKYPKLIDAIENRHVRYNQAVKEMDEMADKKELLLIRPINKVSVSRTEKDQEKLAALYQEGYDIVMNRKEEILAFLK
jgi:predicted patatin/cPLA2 family phospholipase